MKSAPAFLAVIFLNTLLRIVGAAPVSAWAQRQPSATPPTPTTPYPGVTVILNDSPQAQQALVSRKETVIVSASITGFPKPGTPRKDLDGEGQVDLGNFTREILPGRNGVFKTFALNKAGLTRLDQRGPQLLINVYSGRKSSPNNLLDCGIYQGPLQAVENHSIPIACKLIGE